MFLLHFILFLSLQVLLSLLSFPQISITRPPTMSGHKRVKDIDYDDDDIYSGDEEDYENTGDDGLTEEDRHNFSTLTPVVRAELDEAGVQVANKDIEDALWHYFWDVGKSVSYLKNAKQPKTPSAKSTPKEKPKSKFDQAQEKSAEKAGGELLFSIFQFLLPQLDLWSSGKES